MMSLVTSREYKKDFGFFLLSYIDNSQIWLNHLMDYCHFNYITKLEKTLFDGYQEGRYMFTFVT